MPGSGQACVCLWQNLFFAGPGWRQAECSPGSARPGILWLVLVSLLSAQCVTPSHLHIAHSVTRHKLCVGVNGWNKHPKWSQCKLSCHPGRSCFTFYSANNLIFGEICRLCSEGVSGFLWFTLFWGVTLGYQMVHKASNKYDSWALCSSDLMTYDVTNISPKYDKKVEIICVHWINQWSMSCEYSCLWFGHWILQWLWLVQQPWSLPSCHKLWFVHLFNELIKWSVNTTFLLFFS